MIYITKTIDETIWQLQEVDGLKVEVGSIQTSTRDGKTLKFKIQGGTPPHKPSSSGRIWVTDITNKHNREFFPSVCGLKWVEV